MKIDFNFEIEDFLGNKTPLKAKDAMIEVFNLTKAESEQYIDKKKSWAKQVDKNGILEVDVTDAKIIRNWVISGPFRDFAISHLKDFMQEQIDKNG